MSGIRYLRGSRVDASPVGDRVALYHRDTGTALVLNATGTWLWGQMDGPISIDSLAERLRDRYPVIDPEQARHDASAFIAELVAHRAADAEGEGS